MVFLNDDGLVTEWLLVDVHIFRIKLAYSKDEIGASDTDIRVNWFFTSH